MSKYGLHRHYDRLTAEERFRLDVQAMAREDLQESERLVTSCPRFSYIMNDRDFVDRWHNAKEITLRICIALVEQLGKLQMIDVVRVFVPYSQTLFTDMSLDAYFKGHESGSRHAWSYAGEIGAPRRGPTTGRSANSWSPTSTSRTLPWSGTRTI